jgi:hypothetical protein
MSDALLKLIRAKAKLPPAPCPDAQVVVELSTLTGAEVYQTSLAAGRGVAFALSRRGLVKELLLATDAASPTPLDDFAGTAAQRTVAGGTILLKTCPISAANAAALRQHVAYLSPQPLGTATSVGLGDRLGLATPAHLAAVAGTGVLPIVAQQSIREMTRTSRSPQQVIDDATWGVLQAGWAKPWGSDADHLKTTADIDATAAAGFVVFTIDPGEHVDDDVDNDDGPTCRAKYDRLPWHDLEISQADCRESYQDKTFKLPGGLEIDFRETDVKQAAVKYGRAIAHTVRMHRHLVSVFAGRPFELEMSVDETAQPTSPAEHYFVANELARLGVRPVSLAPRFVGRFEKGVDYQGDLGEFRRQFALHAAIARALGPYKISLHSGSDKFSIYPIAAELTGGLVHLKTAGTSYLEALRAIARVDGKLFREILAFAIERYPADRASYLVSADAAKVLPPDQLKDDELESVLDDLHDRQVLHVTFGSVLTARGNDGAVRFKDRLLRALADHEAVHYETVRSHIARHLAPFAK